ncbi:MAG: TorF family putative porin [Gammaproteobacteria bacterium]
MKRIPIITALSMGAGLVMLAAPVAAELNANLGVTSNYIWRGLTQSNDTSAVSGGIDFSHQEGFYAGTWVSSTTANQYEHDLYGGYGFKASDIDLDVGFIQYRYPVTDPNSYDFSEVYVNAKYLQFGAGAALTISKQGTGDDNDLYLYGSADIELKKDLTLNLLVGNYSFDDSRFEDYTHFHASLHKDEFSFAVDKNDRSGADGDARVSVAWSRSFEL